MYPLTLTHLNRIRCLVIGGGSVAERKVGDLLAGGAHPEVISPTVTATLAQWAITGDITHVARAYHPDDLSGAGLVIAATNDHAVNASIAAQAEELSILVNVADDPHAGSFHTVATVRRGDLLLTVSTSGASPALAAHIRHELEARYGDEYAHLLTVLRQVRDDAVRTNDATKRARFWRRLPFDKLLNWVRADSAERVETYVRQEMDELEQRQGGRKQGDKECGCTR